jgi:beta-glucosidase-like glycosyl hydrolase
MARASAARHCIMRSFLALLHCAAGLALQQQACVSPATASLPFCNAALPLEARLDDLMVRVGALNATYADFEATGASVPSLDIPPIDWWTEALHGLGRFGSIVWRAPTPWATMFPMPSLTAGSFNASLFFAISDVISTEGRAFYNVDHAGVSFWSPNVNPNRNPLWGRGQETPSEDPTLCATYAREFSMGLQGNDTRYLKSVATLKHLAGYDLEGFNGTDRFSFNAVISPGDLADYYLAPFQEGVQSGRAAGIMCSYTAINGTPSCASKYLITDVARGDWGFDGSVVADCKAVLEIWAAHHYTSSADATLNATTSAGLDAECGGSCCAMLAPHMAGAVRDGAVAYPAVLAMARRLFRVRMRLGQFDPPRAQPAWVNATPAAVCAPASNALSLSAALQGSALLKNGGGGLPLSPSRVRRLAVVGPNAASTTAPRGNYDGQPCFGAVVSVLEGLSSRLAAAGGAVDFQPGCAIAGNSTAGLSNATAAAAAADATVVVVGLDGTQEGEYNDRASLELPGVQGALITAVCAAAGGRPCILVVVSGGYVDLAVPAADPAVTAILHVGYGGPWGGNATAALVFGDAAPAGRLTSTMYAAAFATNVSAWDMQLRPGASPWPPGTTPGRTHMFYTGTPVFPFGWGLSYTSWAYAFAEAPPAALAAAPVAAYLAAHPRHGALYAPLRGHPVLRVVVHVANTGPVDSAEAVLGFLVPPGAGANGVPRQVLFAFERVFVRAGRAQRVVLEVEARHLTRVAEGGTRVPLRGAATLRVGVEGPGGEPATALATHTVVLLDD